MSSTPQLLLPRTVVKIKSGKLTQAAKELAERDLIADLEQAMAKACADAGLAHLANQPPLRRFGQIH